jgi:predicted dehydrogenase
MTAANTVPARIAVIGAGMIGRQHVERLLADPGCAVAGVADPVPEARAWAERQGLRAFADPAEMLETTRPDGAIVATPNALHLAHAKCCAERGVAMLVEKPLGDTLAAARQLTALARDAGVKLLVGHHRRHNPIIEKAREIVAGGELGEVTAVASLWLLRKADDYYDAAWRRAPGAGPVLNNLVHDIDDLRYVCGEIDSVQASVSSKARGFAVEDTAVVTLRFVSGALGTATVSDAVAAPWSWELTSGENAVYPTQPTENCYLIAGTRGSLTVPRLELWHYDGAQGWNAPLSRRQLDVVHADPLARQIAHFCRVIRDREPPRVTGEDALRTLACTAAVHQAAASGATVAVDAVLATVH